MAKDDITRLQEEINALENAIDRREYREVQYAKDGWDSGAVGDDTFKKIIEEVERIRDGKSPYSSRDYIPRTNWDEEKARVENNFMRAEVEGLKKENTSLKGQNTKLKKQITWRNKELEELKKRIKEMNNFGRADILDFEE